MSYGSLRTNTRWDESVNILRCLSFWSGSWSYWRGRWFRTKISPTVLHAHFPYLSMHLRFLVKSDRCQHFVTVVVPILADHSF